MPELSRFYGIVLRMYYDEHPPPHFHVYYQEHQAAVDVESLAIVRGSLPAQAARLVIEWGLAHRQELRDNWRRVEAGEPLLPIDPLE